MPRLIAFARLLLFAAELMSSLYLSARNLISDQCRLKKGSDAAYFLIVGRETPCRASVGLALMHSCEGNSRESA